MDGALQELKEYLKAQEACIVVKGRDARAVVDAVYGIEHPVPRVMLEKMERRRTRSALPDMCIKGTEEPSRQ